MKRETLEKIRNILEYLFVLFMFILIMLITFGSLHVHAAETSSWSLKTNSGVKSVLYSLHNSNVYADYEYVHTTTDTKYYYGICYTGQPENGQISINFVAVNLSDYSIVYQRNGIPNYTYVSTTTYYNNDGSIKSTSTGSGSGGWQFWPEIASDGKLVNFETDLPIFSSVTSMQNYVKSGDKSGMISEPESPDLIDDAYTFTGFTMNGKTASWTGTTQRSHLLDQDVEEYTTFTYGFASSEDQTVSNFIEYAGEYATADKKLKLPWDEMDTKKKDGEFIRQVNITPCYRVPGAFYRGLGAKVYFHKDGSIDKVVMDTKRTDLNTGNMVYDSSLGYLQNVIYTEEKTHDGKGRQATFKWSTQKSLPEDAQVEIVAQNFYIEWFNKKTQENFVYKEYGEDCIYSTGSYSFNANTPVWTWLKEKEIDPFSIKTQSYGTTEYYLRIVTYDETDLKYHYGGWVRVDIKEKTATRVPSTDVETGDFDDIDGLWKQDTTSDDSYHYSTDDEGKLTGNIDVNSWEDLNMNSFTWLFRNLQSMVSSLGEFPNMITSVFGFLPVQFVTALGVFLVAIVLLRFLGR